MTRIFVGLIGIVIVLYVALVLTAPKTAPVTEPPAPLATSSARTALPDEIVARNLSIPWDIAFLPDNSMLVTERTGDVLHIAPGTTTRMKVSGSVGGEGGLLGIALHPDFVHNNFVYLYLSQDQGGGTVNRVTRYAYLKDVLKKDMDIITGIPGALYHDGGRMEFGPDGKLYVTTGDATRGSLAQDTKSLAGKILRLNDNGSIPADNPFGNAVWSYGHRNPQGITWDSSGQMWESEHGPTGEAGRCCHDEINKIVPGGNYGWPDVIGDETKIGTIPPVLHSGDDTWAPASLIYANGALYFGALKGTALMRATLSNGTLEKTETPIHDTYGRVRTVRMSPDGFFYITTSNADGRGNPTPEDDRIVRIDPLSFK